MTFDPSSLTFDDLDAAELELCRRECLRGNPFPLIAMQWPFLIITDPREAQYFKGEIDNPNNPCLRLDDWQRDDILVPFFDDAYAEIAIKGNTKAGKGCSVSIGVNLWFDIYLESKVILTSQRYDHAVDVIFGEIVKWREKMRFPGPGRLLAGGINDTAQHYMTVANPSTGEGFSGQHGPRTLFIFDEATSISDGFYDDAQKQARKFIALANPRTLFGWFRNLYSPCKDKNLTQIVNGPSGLRRCVTVDGANCCNVRNHRLEKALGPIGGITIEGVEYGHNIRIPPEHFELVKLLIPEQCDYGRYMSICNHADPRHVAVFGHGWFPDEDEEKQVILQSWLDYHTAFHKLTTARGPFPIDAIGLDCSASLDGDETILCAGGAKGINIDPTTGSLHAFQEPDTMATVAWVLKTVRSLGIDPLARRVPLVVDMDGLGKGIGDRLRELGAWVIEYRGNATSEVDPSAYGNLRAEAYGELGRRLNPRGPWGRDPYGIPSDAMLIEELCAPEKIYPPRGDSLRFHISPKRKPPGADLDERKRDVETIYDKIGRSPDRGDAAVMMFHGVRYLGLWSSWVAGASRIEVAFPMDNKTATETMKKVQEEAANPNSKMDDGVRELLTHLGKEASGRIDSTGRRRFGL